MFCCTGSSRCSLHEEDAPSPADQDWDFLFQLLQPLFLNILNFQTFQHNTVTKCSGSVWFQTVPSSACSVGILINQSALTLLCSPSSWVIISFCDWLWGSVHPILGDILPISIHGLQYSNPLLDISNETWTPCISSTVYKLAIILLRDSINQSTE